MILLDGRKVSKEKENDLKLQIDNYIKKGYRKPGLAIILCGNDPASHIYVKTKLKRAAKINIETKLILLKENTKQKELEKIVSNLNKDNNIDGILIQLPLPRHLDQNKIIDLVDPKKDVDGFHIINQGLLFQNRKTIIAATARGIIDLLKYYDIKLEGMDAVVIGRSIIVGNPITRLLQNENATVSQLHRRTKNIKKYTKNADIIISATGVVNLIKKDMVKKGVIIVDVGTNRLQNGKVVGDCDFNGLKRKANYITPVPGGVGPMTVCALLLNLFDLYKINIEGEKL